ncbi:hypothetical protein [Niabella hibiscisoli]|uniref:hypothetical protein n=1 Tax=Niabella hibiscisoli TaxID=1825928 RepID=UPI001F1110FB|nr:hypothetical protein [Niabella hibiscisoli]MCH5720518.1 hypothetical protein [Niabella hibiscisoli]
MRLEDLIIFNRQYKYCFFIPGIMENELSLEQLNKIANEYGTPLYVYNADKIVTQYKRLTTAFQSDKVRFFMPVSRLPILIF